MSAAQRRYDGSGKVGIVTGGSRGIGLAIAGAMLDAGMSVVVSGRSREHLDEALNALARDSSRKGRVHPVQGDVSDASAAEGLVREAVKRFGGLDVLVNNAGVGMFANVADMSRDDWRNVIGTNLDGVFYCCHAAIPELRARGGGWIINISSLAGKNAFVGGAAYCASKAGLNAFSEALMQEVRHDGIRVSYIMPGSVATSFGGKSAQAIGINRPGEEWKIAPEDIAEVVVDLLAQPTRTLPSRIEMRPSQPPRKG